jgi:uncharacterized protein with FMN-binding domain
MPSNRLNRGLISIAATAITAVYTAGYLHTQTADATLGGAGPAPVGAAAAPAPVRPNVTPVQPARVSASAATGSGFKDGTYAGAGTSRRGDIQVSVVVQSGRVANVNITRATTQYPTRFISSLPGEVVSRQSAQVDLVSGATYSSLAFRGAVQQALQRAQA